MNDMQLIMLLQSHPDLQKLQSRSTSFPIGLS